MPDHAAVIGGVLYVPGEKPRDLKSQSAGEEAMAQIKLSPPSPKTTPAAPAVDSKRRDA